MKSRNLLLTSVLTVAVMGAFGVVLSSSLLPANASAGNLISSHLLSSHGGSHGRQGRWAGSHCNAVDDRAIRLASAYVSISLDLDEDQVQAFTPVIEVIDRWHSAARTLCDQEAFSNAPAALSEVRNLVDRTQVAMDELIPAFEGFYAALTADQQARLNGWLAEHHELSATPEQG